MASIDIQLDKKQNVMRGKLTQAKGVVREQWGHLQNDDITRLAGKKDQVVGQLQAYYGNSWIAKRRYWLLTGTAVVVVGTVLAFFFARRATANK